jgi:hypothetical protein
MDPKLTEVNQMFARFKAAYARNDLNACETLLSQLKVRACWISLPAAFFVPALICEIIVGCSVEGGEFWADG